MAVRMLTSISSATASAAPGDMWECSKTEGDRLIAAGLAEAAPSRKSRKAKETATLSGDDLETAVDGD